MYLATAFTAWARVCQATGQISSDLMVLKNVPTSAVIAVSTPVHRDQDAQFPEQGLLVD